MPAPSFLAIGRSKLTTLLLAMPLLSACNSTDSAVDPFAAPTPAAAVGSQPASPETVDAAEPADASAPDAALQPVAITPVASAAPTTLNAQVAALSTNARVQFAPIVGATVEAVTPLTRRLSQRAASRGIALAGNGDAASTHMMKGYFSAIYDGGETTVIYVWDVLDPAGNRLHRIQGQEKVAGVTAEGWQGVPSETMEAVGDSTIDQLADWLAKPSG